MSQKIRDFFNAYSLLNHPGGNRMAKNMSASGDLYPCTLESSADEGSDSGALEWSAYAVAMTDKHPPLFCWRASAAQI